MLRLWVVLPKIGLILMFVGSFYVCGWFLVCGRYTLHGEHFTFRQHGQDERKIILSYHDSSFAPQSLKDMCVILKHIVMMDQLVVELS